MELLVIVSALILFGVAAWTFGADSRDGPDSPEWQRRQHWKGFGGSGR